MKRIKHTSWIVLCFVCNWASAQTQFSDFNAFVSYASEKSISLKKNEIELSQAKKSRLAAFLGVLDPSGNTTLSYRNNTQLPVTLVPSQLLGGRAGDYERVKFGLQYETQLLFNGEMKLLNLAGWQNLRQAETNILLADNQRAIQRKQFFEATAGVYYHIVTLHEQHNTARNNLQIADTLFRLVKMRLEKGLASQQDVNEAQISYLQMLRSIEQIDFELQHQYTALRIICDLPETEAFEIRPSASTPASVLVAQRSGLMPQNTLLRLQMANGSYKRTRLEMMPSLSLFFSLAQQQFSNNPRLLEKNNSWIPSSYVGVRLGIPLPTAGMISQRFKSKYDVQLAQQDYQQAQVKANNEAMQLTIAHQKALANTAAQLKILRLKKDTYHKNQMSYQAGITTLGLTLRSFQEMLNAEYEWVAAGIAAQLAAEKININNNF